MAGVRRTYADRIARIVTEERVPYHFRDELLHVTYELPGAIRLAGTVYDGRDVLDGTFASFSDTTAAGASGGEFFFSWGNLVAGTTLSKRFGSGADSTVVNQRLSTSR